MLRFEINFRFIYFPNLCYTPYTFNPHIAWTFIILKKILNTRFFLDNLNLETNTQIQWWKSTKNANLETLKYTKTQNTRQLCIYFFSENANWKATWPPKKQAKHTKNKINKIYHETYHSTSWASDLSSYQSNIKSLCCLWSDWPET